MKKFIVIIILAVALVSYVHSTATQYATDLKERRQIAMEAIR